MLKVVAAPNALKGSLSSFAAASAIAAGAKRAAPQAEVIELGIADGGDGTAEVICRARGGEFREVLARDALGRPVPARYAWLTDRTAVVDVATASGLARLEPHERDAGGASSYGTGELIRAALEAGATRIIVGVGGSASVDGGAGILEALGARLLDDSGRPLPPGGTSLRTLARIDVAPVIARAWEVPIDVACDVDIPLIGRDGAARLFGPQKGASPELVEQLDRGLSQLAHLLRRDFGRDVATLAWGGAAGGIAAGLFGALRARLLPGAELVLDEVGFDDALRDATLCITAEGLLDRQSLLHKAPIAAARRAAARGVATVALGGGIASDVTDRDFPLFAGIFSICPRPLSLREALRDAEPLLASTAERVVRLFEAGRSARA